MSSTEFIHPQAARELLIDEAVHHILRTRELLVRFDENMKAWTLLFSTVPLWAQDDPRIVAAVKDQFEMVKHALDPAAYEAYYADNPHERPFEEQTGLTVETADQIPRVKWLADRLADRKPGHMVDLSANDGWMLAHFQGKGMNGYGFDLNQGAVERAKDRGVRVYQSDFRSEKRMLRRAPVVTLFETIEHLPNPIDGLVHAARYVEPGGSLFVSTPIGATEGGNLPAWDHVERKGHLWSFRPQDFHQILGAVGTVEAIDALPDRTMIAEVSVGR